MRNPAAFTDQVLDAYDHHFSRPDEADPTEHERSFGAILRAEFDRSLHLFVLAAGKASGG
jgi:hypothetical protein